MKNPNGPPTDSQLEKATQAHEHMVRSTDLNARVKAEMPAVYEKLQAGSVDDLTKAEASQFISTERAYNREISNRKATPEQVKMIETLLQEHPDLYEGLKAGRELAAGEKAVARYKEAQEAGELTHGMVQDLLQVVHDRIREDAKTNLNQAVDLMKSLTPEDLTFVTQATLTRMQVKKGSPLQGEAEKYVSDYIRVLVDPAAEQANLVAAEKYFLKLERAQVLREAAQEFASV